jgi:hypothetical protein
MLMESNGFTQPHSPGLSAKKLERLSVRRIGALAAFVGCYLIAIGWFKLVDVYHTNFSTSGALVLAYNLFRIGFAFYLFWIIYTPGALLVRALANVRVENHNIFDAVALNFFAGTGLWHVALLALGYLGLYTVPVAIGITLPIVALSFFDFSTLARTARAAWSDRRRANLSLTRLTRWILSGVAVAAAVMLLAAKGLYPAGGNDYFAHYFRFYEWVIDHHGVWPNEIWYHYFYSKGAGLYFLGMLLTDSLAPQLVTFCFFMVAGLVVFRFIDRFAPGSLWPWVGVILLFSIYLYTPGRGEFRGNGGWADFEKLHELNASLIVAILWMAATALDSQGRRARPWIAGAASATVAAIIVNVTIAVYLGAVFVLLTGWFLISRNRRSAVICFGLACASGVVLGAILAINYFTTGLLNDQPLLYFLPIANIEKLYRWGALGWTIMIYQGTEWLATQAAPLLSGEFAWQFLHFLRAYILFPLFGGGLLLSIIAAAMRPSFRRRVVDMSGEAPVIALTSAVAAFAIFAAAGRAQYISFFRYSSFIVPILLVIGIALWSVSLEKLVPNVTVRRICAALLAPVVVGAVWMATVASFEDPALFRSNLANSWAFASGRYSIDRAYTTQSFVGRFAWGAIYPGARAAYAIVGPGTLIWSFQISSFCMLPDCMIATYPAFLMGRDWDRVMFAAPEEARDALQKAGINYFLFSKELGFSDPLMTAPLFKPDQIGRYLGIRWTDGTTALLTWLQPGVQRLDPTWLESYRQIADTAASVESLRDVFARLRATPHPWRSVVLP